MTLPAASSFPSRGFSRRNFLRAAAASSALASLPFVTEAHLAHAAIPKFAPSDQGIHIDANENPMGPSEGARKAIAAMIPDGGRYLFDKEIVISEIFARQQGLDPEMVVRLRRLQRAAAPDREGVRLAHPAAGHRRPQLRSAHVGGPDRQCTYPEDSACRPPRRGGA